MKKIVFVQKKDNSAYDSVDAFFSSKKTASVSKPTSSKTSTSVKPPPIAKKPINTAQKGKLQNPKLEEITPKVGHKGDNRQNKNIPSKNLKKEKDESIYGSKKQLNKSKEVKRRDEQVQEREDSIDKYKLKEEEKVKSQKIPIQGDNQLKAKVQKLSKRVKQLQANQQEYQRKIEQYEQKEEKFIKSQQKISKLSKEMKANALKSKEADDISLKLKQKQEDIKQLMENKSIPFNSKREVLLSNRIRQLKRVNHQLVMRIKSYKGTDVMELSMQQNKQQISKDLDAGEFSPENTLNVEMQSLISNLVHQLNSYISERVSAKSGLSWAKQHQFLMEMVKMSERISLKFLDEFDVCPLPKSNEDCLNYYNLFEQFQKTKMAPLMSTFDINMKIGRQNIHSLKDLGQNQEARMELIKVSKSPSKNSKGWKLSMNTMRVHEIRCNFSEILLVQNICQMKYLKEWINKVHGQLKEQLKNVTIVIQQIKNIAELGPNAKESLYIFVEDNIHRLSLRLPDLQVRLKEIQSGYKQLQRQVCQTQA